MLRLKRPACLSQNPNMHTPFSSDGDPKDSVFGPLKWVEPGRVIPVPGRLSLQDGVHLVASLGYIARLPDGYSLAFAEEPRTGRGQFPHDH